MSHEIGLRIAERLQQVRSGIHNQEFARSIHMDPSAFSRAMSGKRGFSTDEVVTIAQVLDTDANFLLTGIEDPLRVRKAARCTYSPATQRYSAPTTDDQVIQDIKVAYGQVWPNGVPDLQDTEVPDNPPEVRNLLGHGFAHDFANRVEEKLGVDVIQLAELETDYTLSIGNCRVILLNATPYWFRRNWSLAHELAHVARKDWIDHHGPRGDSDFAANVFAAELLMPETEIRAIPWKDLDGKAVAHHVVRFAVSTTALKTRLQRLNIAIDGTEVQSALEMSTPKLAERYLGLSELAALAKAEQGSSARRFPNLLVWSHQLAVESGEIAANHLAWMLGVAESDFDSTEAESPEAFSADELADELGITVG